MDGKRRLTASTVWRRRARQRTWMADMRDFEGAEGFPSKDRMRVRDAGRRRRRELIVGHANGRRTRIRKHRACPIGEQQRDPNICVTRHHRLHDLVAHPDGHTRPQGRLPCDNVPINALLGRTAWLTGWPTPTANEFEIRDVERMRERREECKAKGYNGNGFGMTLGMTVMAEVSGPTLSGSPAGTGIQASSTRHSAAGSWGSQPRGTTARLRERDLRPARPSLHRACIDTLNAQSAPFKQACFAKADKTAATDNRWPSDEDFERLRKQASAA